MKRKQPKSTDEAAIRRELEVKIQKLEAELAICRPKAAVYDRCSAKVDCLSRGEA